MPETYSKAYHISKMMRHIENSCMSEQFIQAFSDNTQVHSAIFSYVHAYWGRQKVRHIQALLRHIESYSEIFKTLCNPCICNHAIFKTLTHLEPGASSSVCGICKMIRHVQCPGIIRTVYSTIFKDI